jgi:hypothetical protein
MVYSNNHKSFGLFGTPIFKDKAIGLRKHGTNKSSYGYPLVGNLSLLAQVFGL